MATEKERRLDFCTECGKETEYEIKKAVERETVREKEYEFTFTVPVCKECGARMCIPGFLDRNIRERDEQYRGAEGILSVENIKKLVDIYGIGKAPLSLALGFGETAISRYLDGQVPSKDCSDIMENALSSPRYMENLLDRNREKMGETAYQKAVKAAAELKHLSGVSDKMLASIAYIFGQMQEVTPLALQKILYYVQGIYMALFGAPLFPENCCAWQHGPVYEKVYFLFRDYKYNPIDDNRFAFFPARPGGLSGEERTVIDLVVKTFGRYSGKTLETITHKEEPWKEARRGRGRKEHSNSVMPKESIQSYFEKISGRYGINSAEGLNRYIHAQLDGTFFSSEFQ